MKPCSDNTRSRLLGLAHSLRFQHISPSSGTRGLKSSKWSPSNDLHGLSHHQPSRASIMDARRFLRTPASALRLASKETEQPLYQLNVVNNDIQHPSTQTRSTTSVTIPILTPRASGPGWPERGASSGQTERESILVIVSGITEPMLPRPTTNPTPAWSSTHRVSKPAPLLLSLYSSPCSHWKFTRSVWCETRKIAPGSREGRCRVWPRTVQTTNNAQSQEISDSWGSSNTN